MSFLKSCGRRKRGAVSFQSCSLFNFLFENCRKLTTKRSRKLIHLYQSRCLEIIWEREIKMFHVVTSLCCQSVYTHLTVVAPFVSPNKTYQRWAVSKRGRPSFCNQLSKCGPGPRPGPRLAKSPPKIPTGKAGIFPPNSASSGGSRRRRVFPK